MRYGTVEFCVIYFPRVELALVLWNVVLYFLLVECALVLCNFVLYFSICSMCSVILVLCFMFFCLRNALWYCGILCYMFLHVERALLLWISVLYFPSVLFFCCMRVVKKKNIKIKYFMFYFSSYETRSVVLCCIFLCVGRTLVFCVIFLCVRNALWYFVLYFFCE